MANPRISELYVKALQAYNREPKDGEMDAWLNVLGGFGPAEINLALRRWQADTWIEEFTGRPRGARMPSAAELKLSIDQSRRTQKTNRYGCPKCNSGWVMAGVDRAGNPCVRRCECVQKL